VCKFVYIDYYYYDVLLIDRKLEICFIRIRLLSKVAITIYAFHMYVHYNTHTEQHIIMVTINLVLLRNCMLLCYDSTAPCNPSQK
jgi:hypothetical protein